jgi:hypothetical protein
MAFVIGIDPGKKGGVAIIPVYDFRGTSTISLEKTTLQDLVGILEGFKSEDAQVDIFLENPSLPFMNFNNRDALGNARKFSVQAYTKLYRSIGQLEGVCNAFGYIPTLISPIKWQNALETRTKGNKRVTLDLAKTLFPFLSRVGAKGQQISEVTHAVADALLIGLYGYLQVSNPKYWTREVKNRINPVNFIKKEGKKTHVRLVQQPSVPDRIGPVGVTSRRKMPPRGRKLPPRAR